jgi:P-type Cu+ transporter
MQTGLASAPATAEVSLAIEGMTCAACAARVERRLSRLAGVTASVSFATERAEVTAPASLPAAELIQAVAAAGYTATVAAPVPDQAAYLRRRLTVAVIFFVPLSDLSVQFSVMPSFRIPGWQWLLAALAAPVVLWAAWPFHRAAARYARHGGMSMDTLVSLGVIAACGWSAYAMVALDSGPQPAISPLQLLVHASGGGIYLEVAATVTTFLLAGRYYEARARRLAGEAMRELAEAGAQDACLLSADGTERRVPAAALRAGDLLVVRPGEKIAADGLVEFGQSDVDRAVLTGESVPADVTVGDPVTAGMIVLTGRLVVRADRTGPDTQLAQLTRLVERAQADKAAVQRLADRVAGVFVPAVLALAAVTLGGWLLAGSSVQHAFSCALAVLIIACPCALGLATPAALAVACGRGAQLGIFIKGYPALEASRSISTVVFDKTGTVTTGQMTVTAIRAAGDTDEAELLRLSGSVEQASGHPVAAAITAAAGQQPGTLEPVTGFRALPGLGARGIVAGREVIIGRPALLRDRDLTIPADLAGYSAQQESAGQTAVLAGWDGQARGAFVIADTIRPSAAAAVAGLRRMGLRTVLLTGDATATARAVADAAGIDEVAAEVLPAGKADYITALRQDGQSVAMVGDGINDGPALASATLGLAIGTGTAVAIGAADMILLRDDLQVVPDAIRLARATYTTIRRNLGWAFGYNLAAIPLAAAGFLNPLVAAAAMTLSSAFVVGSSLRLRRLTASQQPGIPRSALVTRPGGPVAGLDLSAKGTP